MDCYENQAMTKSQVDVSVVEEPASGIKMEVLNNDIVIEPEIEETVEIETKESAYDPYKNRNVEQPTSYFDTSIHLLKASMGTGILAMPSAFRNAGYVVGTLGTIAVAMLCTFTIHLLIDASYALCVKKRVPSLTYSGTVAAAFEEGPVFIRKYAPHARFITDTFLVMYQLGSSAVYCIFVTSNVKAISDFYFDTDTDVRLFMLIMLLPFVMISRIKHLKLLAPYSSIANCLTAVSFTLIFYYIFRETPSFENRETVGTVRGIPTFFGTVLFAMEAIGMVLPLENEMKNPKNFGSPFGVINTSMIPISIMYMFVGLFGYLKYGDKTTGSITLDMPQTELLSQVVKLFLSISIFICYALSNYVAFDIIWKRLEPKVEKIGNKHIWENVVRTSCVFITLLLAVAVPNLEDLISLIGAFCLSTVGIALPGIVNYLTFYDDFKSDKKLRFYLFCLRSILIITIAIFAFIVGLYTSVLNIVQHMIEPALK